MTSRVGDRVYNRVRGRRPTRPGDTQTGQKRRRHPRREQDAGTTKRHGSPRYVVPDENPATTVTVAPQPVTRIVRQRSRRAGTECPASVRPNVSDTPERQYPGRVDGTGTRRSCSRQEVGIRHPLTASAACHELTASASAIGSLDPLSRAREPYSAPASVITAGDELERRPVVGKECDHGPDVLLTGPTETGRAGEDTVGARRCRSDPSWFPFSGRLDGPLEARLGLWRE